MPRNLKYYDGLLHALFDWRPMRHVQMLTLLLVTWFSLSAFTVAAIESTTEDQGRSEFVKLFNGKDLAGWVVEGTKEYRLSGKTKPVWTVEDGVIHCAGVGYGFLRYDKEFSDFILKFEFLSAPKCNSGVGIRHVKFTGPKESRPSNSGYEIQLLDDHEKAPDDHSTGSLYRHIAPTENAIKPAGSWNDITITCRGPHIKIVLNGVTVQDVDQSKVRSVANKPLSGYVSLQNHGGRVEFRNVQLKEIP